MKNRIHDCKCACPKCGIKGGSNTCTCGCRKCTNSSYGYRSKKEINMTNLQKHTEKVLEEFEKLFTLRSNHVNITLNTTNGLTIEMWLLQALLERDEVIIKMLEDQKKNLDLHEKCLALENEIDCPQETFNEALDKAIEIIKGEDE